MNRTTRVQWYVNKGTRVQGPFEESEIRWFMELGRITTSDRVSVDGEGWEPVSQVPQLVPESLLHGIWMPDIEIK